MTTRTSITLAAFLVVLAACGSPAAPSGHADGTGAGSYSPTTSTGPSHGFGTFGGPISSQGGGPTTSLVGYVDPSNPQWSGGMVACLSGCSGATADQNRVAVKQVIDYAASSLTPRIVYIPPGQYPISCSGGRGVDFDGDSNVTIEGWGATFRLNGSSADCAMFLIHNASHVKLRGLTFSLRDATSATANTVAVKIGDGGTSGADDITLLDNQFIEGVGGDFVRLDGGLSAVTVARVGIDRCRFEGSARAGVDIRAGAERFRLAYSFFRSNANRDIWFEDVGDGPTGLSTIIGNMIETDKTIPAVTLSGHGGANVQEQSTFIFNRIIQPASAANAANTTVQAGGGTLEGSGLARTQISYNTIVTNRATSAPTIALTGNVSDVWIHGNFIDRRGAASSAAVVQVASDGVSAPANVLVRGNRIKQYSGIAPGIDVSGCDRCSVLDNNITYHASTADSGATGFVGVYCSGAVKPCSGLYERNSIRRDDQDIKASLNLATVTTNDNTVCEFSNVGQEGNTATLQFIGDSLTNAGTAGGSFYAPVIHFKPGGTTVAQAETLLNLSSCHVKTSGTGTNVLQAGDAFGPTALTGAAAAGRALAGIEVLKGTGTTVNRIVYRDNWVDGARDIIYSDADGSAQYPETFPLISGNSSIGTTNEFEGGITTWVTESTGSAEAITNGALSVSKPVTFITTSGTVAYTLADGINDRSEKLGKIKSATSTPNGTLTPTHFADGTTHTISWTAVGGWFRLRWDTTNTTWRLVGSSGVTIN